MSKINWHLLPCWQHQLKTSLSMLLNLNIKNASNAVNHSAIFIILNAFSFFAADIDLRIGQRYLQWVLCHGIQRQPLQQLPASQNTTCTKWLPNL